MSCFVGAPFEWDTFLSYAHGPGSSEADRVLTSWTVNFAQALKGQIALLLDRHRLEFEKTQGRSAETFRLFTDFENSAGAQRLDQFPKAARSSATLIVVLSNAYLLSKDHCRPEMIAFLEGPERAQNFHSERTIFVVEAVKTKREHWPNEFRSGSLTSPYYSGDSNNLLCFKFYDESAASGGEFPLDWSDASRRSQEMAQRQMTLARQIVERLAQIKSELIRSASTTSVRPQDLVQSFLDEFQIDRKRAEEKFSEWGYGSLTRPNQRLLQIILLWRDRPSEQIRIKFDLPTREDSARFESSRRPVERDAVVRSGPAGDNLARQKNNPRKITTSLDET